MKILENDVTSSGWITAIIEDRWIHAKVYNEPSKFGVNGGRVSKICIGKNGCRDPNKPSFDQMCYQHDRELDFDEAPEGLVDKIIAELEKLP